MLNKKDNRANEATSGCYKSVLNDRRAENFDGEERMVWEEKGVGVMTRTQQACIILLLWMCSGDHSVSLRKHVFNFICSAFQKMNWAVSTNLTILHVCP